MDHLRPWLRLQLTPGLGRAALIRLIEHFGSPQDALTAAVRGWPKLPGLRDGLAPLVPAAASAEVDQALARIEAAGARLLTLWDAGYPPSLRKLPDPPATLYICGELPDGPALALVGTRRPTPFGRAFAERLAEELAAAGMVIVSGLARGIDTAAHRGALNAGGATVAVLGCGIERIYPPENAPLYRAIPASGALLTEYPPGSEPLPGHFPGRNRIISGLAMGTLVVEASRDSGSLITAEFALEQGREVMAVPGGVDHDTSYGPNLLLKQGAHPVTEAAEVLQILGIDGGQARARRAAVESGAELPGTAGEVLARLGLTPRHSDELAGESGLTPMELSAILLHLELNGYAEKLPGGRYILGRRAR